MTRGSWQMTAVSCRTRHLWSGRSCLVWKSMLMQRQYGWCCYRRVVVIVIIKGTAWIYQRLTKTLIHCHQHQHPSNRIMIYFSSYQKRTGAPVWT